MRRRDGRAKCLGAVLAATLALTAAAGRAADAGTPRREDRGELIVLHLYGSYYDMGRQQAELLGPVARTRPRLRRGRLAAGRRTDRRHERSGLRWRRSIPARAPFEIAAASSVLRAVIADRQGRRGDAVRFFQHAQATMDRHPEFTDRFTGALRAAAGAGVAAPLADEDLPALPDLQHVPE